MKEEKTQVLFKIEQLKENHCSYEGPFSVVLVTREGKQPWIRVISQDGYCTNSFSLAGLFKPQLEARDVMQYHGDGPERSTVSEQAVWRAANEAMRRLTRQDGHLEVVWVPNDPSMPF